MENTEIIPVPLNSNYSYHTLDLIKTLKNSTILKIAMKQTKWEKPKFGGGFSNQNYQNKNKGGFDFGYGDDLSDDEEEEESLIDDYYSGKKSKEKKKPQKEVKEEFKSENILNVDEPKILEAVCS